MQLTKLLARLGLAAFALSTLNLQLSTAFAQGTAFTYQGVLSQNGAAINGSNDLTFTLYNAVSGGTTVGASNVVNDLVMTNGLFTVTLDFGAGAFDGTERWLQIAARPGASTGAYTNLAPRTPIAPTPYAIYAGGANAANLVGTVADARLSANVALRAGANAFSGNQIISGGNIGIGTATPNNLLDLAAGGVMGNSTVLGLNIHDTLNRGTKVSFGYNVPGTEFNGMRAVVNPGTALCGNSGDLLFYTWECNTAPSREVMRINGHGNVGISTTNPVTTLDVRSASPAITVGTTFGTSGALFFGNPGHGVKRAYSGGNDVGLYTTAADVYLSANGTATSEFVLKNNGNVGIGTSSPATKLTVNESTYGIEHTDGTRRLATYIDASGCYFGTISTDPLLFYVNNGAASMMVNTNGNVGIGTVTPDRPLTVNAVGYGIEHTDGTVKLDTYVDSRGGWLGTVSPHALNFFVGEGESSMTIALNGNVGVGTSNPSSTLEVAGTVAATGLRAPGAGINTGTFAFTHRATAESIVGNQTFIVNPLCDGDPDAILIVTHNFSKDTSANPYHPQVVGVAYTGFNWEIFHEDTGTPMEVGDAFNVMVIKP